KSEMTAEVASQFKEAAVYLGKFLWAPSGRHLYFEGCPGGESRLWRVTVDPQTLRWVAGPERLTTDAGFDRNIALSKDGKKLAYTIRVENSRIWSLPFDAVTGQVKGAGQPVTDAGMDALGNDLSRDSKKLSFFGSRAGKWERWEKSLEDNRAQLLAAEDDFIHEAGFWSRDGTHLVGIRFRPIKANETQVSEGSVVIYPAGGGDEQVLTSSSTSINICWDWSADGRWVLGSANPRGPGRAVIWLLPVVAAPHAETQARVVTSSEEYALWQTRFSPDERWISFGTTKKVTNSTPNTIYVVPASGGEWIRITEGKNWDDKPRWSPDGKTIYFTSNRTGFLNVYGIHFDPAAGKPLGEPFRVVAFESPSRMILTDASKDHLGVAANRLVVTLQEVSGNIWVLENVDR